MGTGVEDYLNKQTQYGKLAADKSATSAATQGTKAAMKAARTSGLNKGQSALAAAQQAGDIYSGAYNQNLEAEQNRYVGATGQYGSKGSEMYGRATGQQAMGMENTGAMANMAQNQMQNAQNQAALTWGTIGTGDILTFDHRGKFITAPATEY